MPVFRIFNCAFNNKMQRNLKTNKDKYSILAATIRNTFIHVDFNLKFKDATFIPVKIYN